MGWRKRVSLITRYKLRRSFQKVMTSFAAPQWFSSIGYYYFFNFTKLAGVKLSLITVLVCIYLITGKVEEFFISWFSYSFSQLTLIKPLPGRHGSQAWVSHSPCPREPTCHLWLLSHMLPIKIQPSACWRVVPSFQLWISMLCKLRQ